ncbi:hypothetical protein U91I_01461 [alpha proteobacterium U9-1i]|nr:hypothetical protein U91I_01461 [alpha proteobacterium U9-1i]
MTDDIIVAPPARSDGYIPGRKADLAAAIATQAGPDPDAATMNEVLRLLGALLHHGAHTELEQLKSLYDPLDPDAPPARRDSTPEAFALFEAAFTDALERANFREIEAETVQTRETTKQLTGLSIKASLSGIRRIRFFARGQRHETIELKEWFGLRKRLIDAEVMNDVVVLVGFKAAGEIGKSDRGAFAQMRRGIRPGAALVKHFRNVAAPELVTLHPGAKPSMRGRDQVFLAAPALAGGVPVLLNLWPALTVLGAVAAAYFTAGQVIDNERLTRAVGALGGLVAVGAFVMRQRMKLEATTLRYQKRLADTVYFRNLANNAGVIDLVIGQGEEQDTKEAYLAYCTLRRAGRALAKGEIDNFAEEFLREHLGQEVDFEIQDALEKLEHLGLVTRDGDAYSATPPGEALLKLDAAWDALFNFSARR